MAEQAQALRDAVAVFRIAETAPSERSMSLRRQIASAALTR